MARQTEDSSERASLQEVGEHDLELLMAWRSHPQVYTGFSRQDAPLSWEEHVEWWRNRQHRKDWIIVLQDGGWIRKVGSLSVTDLSQDVPEMGLYIGEVSLQGRGIGRKAIVLATDWLKKRGYLHCQAVIQDNNLASQRAFTSAGFRLDGPAGQGVGRFHIEL